MTDPFFEYFTFMEEEEEDERARRRCYRYMDPSHYDDDEKSNDKQRPSSLGRSILFDGDFD